MDGEMDPLYIQARTALLDALIALEAHRDSIVLIGAQAIYLRTGQADLAVTPYTTDGDLAIYPDTLEDDPLLEDAMRAAGFAPDTQPGQWVRLGELRVDLLVPETLVSEEGSRGARIPPHDKRAARKVLGIEGCIVDNDQMVIASLDPADARSVEALVAGPGGLLVAKLFKLAERIGTNRMQPKDALDIFRLLRAIETSELHSRLEVVMSSDMSAEIGVRALRELGSLFGEEEAAGTQMVGESLRLVENPASVKASCAALARDLLEELGSIPQL